MKKYKKIIVICPGNSVTGGPEALHNLVHDMVRLGLPAGICYFPFDKKFNIPDQYLDFRVNLFSYDDSAHNLIIFPETYPMDALSVKHADSAIWWLSVDHFTSFKYDNILRDKLNYMRLIIKRKRPLFLRKNLKGLINFAQSHYSKNWLNSFGIKAFDLFEPINDVFLKNSLKIEPRGRIDRILYNPSKGRKYVDNLISSFPFFEFVPLVGMSRDQLIELYRTSKLYIDFGHHPGRDRIPREAVSMGCCLITGLKGSTANSIDIPLDCNYKINTESNDFYKNFQILANDIFKNFDIHYKNHNEYRKRILIEPDVFKRNIISFFDNLHF